MKNLIFALLLLLTHGCQSFSAPEKEKNKIPVVLVSVAPYKKIISELVQDKVEVVCIIPAHVDPHNWEPTYRDVSLFQNAKVWFTIGESFEPRLLKKLLDSNKDLQEVSLAAAASKELHGTLPQDMVNLSYTKHPHATHHHSLDTHFWLDPLLAIVQARAARETLSNLFPEHAAFFTENFLLLKNRLLALDETLQEALAPYKGNILVTSHGAYTYYCFRYGLYQLSIEPSSGKEPRAQEVSFLVAEMKKRQDELLAIILQPQHTNKAAKVLATDLHLPLHTIDPYAEDYEKTLFSLTCAIDNSSCL